MSIIIALIYGLSVGAVVVGVGRARREATGANEVSPRAAVVVAARNEEASIATCLEALATQTARGLEVVVVDDHSTDRTFDRAREAAEHLPGIQVIRSDHPPGKKHALMAGIEASSAAVLLFTDADCRPEPGWAQAMLDAFDSQTAMVAAYSGQHPRDAIFRGVAALETAANAATAAAMIGLGRPVMCTARSMGYTREAYRAAGGLEPVADEPSGDDTLMLQRIASVRPHGIRYCFAPASRVPTQGPGGWATWLRQKGRHLSTVRRYPASALMVTLAVRSMDLLIVAGVPLALLGLVGAAPLWAFGAKFMADAAGLWATLGAFGERRLLVYLPVLELVHSPVLILGGLVGAVRRPRWKS